MILNKILDQAHALMKKAVHEGSAVIDGTCGNGHDTLFLSNLVGDDGHVYAFDIQEQAVENTKARLKEHHRLERTTVIHDSHTHIEEHLQEDHKGMIQAAIYNLGYLPGSDKRVITKPDDTITSIQTVLKSLKKGGLVVLVVYHGHPGGKEEKDAVLDYVSSLDHRDYEVLNYSFINKDRTPPFIIAIEKNV
ncbi:methyltransferase domain-containing protein [Halobacillus litoralis]|uniref:Methyltransferase domain-containing protein n=1 Tax=Halobacillus litoralis TaxID=45668 RepID=A0A845E4L3_9BACI|nr:MULTISPECIES: class I SAM-dependent methyltransferase [Halobacillus]MYL21177.1 methyltransferase domain-containing protein [Halobacillus litoralis]MYL31289.1 methyltransferase domain-containing protein [Halobacillus halophilus]MYL38559.1 methyltransferase domain-containing protein [Halobacillus litoralis]